VNGRRRQPDEGSLFGKRRRLILFLGVALFLVGGAVRSDVVAAVGAVTALSTVLVWSYVSSVLDGLAHAVHETRLRVDLLRVTLRRDGDGGDDERADPVDRLQQRYAADEISEAEFERRMETVLQTDDEEVAELIVEE
jgi:hypothetical protein